MRCIKYYDRIHTEWIDLEVTDDVAKFLMKSDKWLRRKQNQYNLNNISLNTTLYTSEDNDEITYEDVLTKNENENNAEITPEKKKLFELVWKIVKKLSKIEQKLVNDIFVVSKSQKQIATELQTSESNVSQLKKTMLLHLTYYFYTDNEFMQTDIYKRNKNEFEYDLVKLAKEIDNESGLEFNLNDIYNLTKDNTQMLKMISSLGVELNENQKELFTFMNRTVKQTLEKLDVNWNENNTITIPANLKIPEELKFKK